MYIILGIIVFVAFVFLVSYRNAHRAEIIGAQGEAEVDNILFWLNKKDYIVLDDVMIPSRNNFTQIDQIVVSIYGIFVIETKNYQGWIYGSEYSEQWTSNIYGNKNSFYNPVKQNYGHIKSLSKLLELDEKNFISIVTFSDSAEIKGNYNSIVINFSDLRKVIKGYKDIKFTREEIQQITNTIKLKKCSDKETAKIHKQKIKENITISNEKIRNNICPKCNGNLVERSGKFGKFLGCSNYPKCRYTKQL